MNALQDAAKAPGASLFEGPGRPFQRSPGRLGARGTDRVAATPPGRPSRSKGPVSPAARRTTFGTPQEPGPASPGRRAKHDGLRPQFARLRRVDAPAAPPSALRWVNSPNSRRWICHLPMSVAFRELLSPFGSLRAPLHWFCRPVLPLGGCGLHKTSLHEPNGLN